MHPDDIPSGSEWLYNKNQQAVYEYCLLTLLKTSCVKEYADKFYLNRYQSLVISSLFICLIRFKSALVAVPPYRALR